MYVKQFKIVLTMTEKDALYIVNNKELYSDEEVYEAMNVIKENK